jgi:hypothetical protein
MKQWKLTVLTLLGLSAFMKTEDGKEHLTEEQKGQLKVSFGDEVASEFIAALEKEGSGETIDPETSAAMAVKLSTHLQKAIAVSASIAKSFEEMKAENLNLKGSIGDLTKKIDILAKKPEDDPLPSGRGASDPKTRWIPTGKDTHLFGSNAPFMAIDDAHPYNQRAYAAIARNFGLIIPTREASSTDYASLKSDLGEFYRVRYTDQIHSFIKDMPSLSNIFPTQSNLQDEAIIANIFSTEFSQAWNPGSTFANLQKGSFKFEQEKIKMYDGTIVHTFTDMKDIEKTWIGYINKEGSGVIKWSLLEYLMVEVAKRAQNELEIRRLKGVYKAPTINTPGASINLSNGLLKRMKLWLAEFKLQPFSVGEWNAGNICNKVKEMTAMIPEHIRMTGQIVLYMSSDAWSLYLQNHELLHGGNMDYKADIKSVKEYPEVTIVPIPGMAPSKRMIWTYKGNFFLAEDKPGEMYAFNFEQQDFTLKCWSIWKESIWASAVGKKRASAAEFNGDYLDQAIWCNDVDEPADYFVSMDADDVTPSVINHTSLVTVANAAATAITGIDDAVVGQEIRIKWGNATNAPTIAKSGNFSLLPAAITAPEVGDIIYLKKRSDGKFIQVKYETVSSDAIVIAADDTTPDVSTGTVFITSVNTVPTAITTFDNAVEGTPFTVYGGSDTNASTIADSGNFDLVSAMTLGAGTYIVLQLMADAKFYEISRG